MGSARPPQGYFLPPSQSRGNLAVFAVMAALMALAPVRTAFAQSKTVTIEDAYRLAAANNEAVRISGEGVSQSDASVDKAISALLPHLSAEGAYTRYNAQKSSGTFVTQPDESSRLDVKLTQSLYSGGTEWSAYKQSKLRLERSSAGYGHTKQSVMLQTARAYFDALRSHKDVEIKRAALKRADERRKVAAARFKVGEVTKSAVLREEAETAKAEAELIKAESALKNSVNFLKRVIAVPEDITLVEPELMIDVSGGIDELLNTAYEKRLDFRQSELDRKVAGEGIEFAKGNFLPSLRLDGLYSRREQSPQTTFFLKESVSATVVLTYPIFEGGLRKAELTEARSKLREAEFRKQGLKRDIEVEVREAFNNMESVRALVESYKKQLSFAEEDYKMVFEQYKYGLATTVDVIDADTTLISAQRSYTSSNYDLQFAVLNLKYVIGVLPAGMPD